MTPYLHQTPNRIRIRSSWIQRHPHEVEKLIEQLRTRDGKLRSRAYFCLNPA